jgi:rod shape-determining protein MreC
MKKSKIYLQILSVIVSLLVFYFIWPLPFKFVSKKFLIPTVSKSTSLFSRLIEPVRIIGKIKELDDKNKQLERENLELKAKAVQAEEQRSKCVSQIDEAGLAQKVDLRMIQALVVGKSPFSFNQVYIINKGFDDRVQQGSAVTTGGYLLGQISEVSHNSAIVKLITRHDSLVPAVTLNSRQSGLVQGGLAGITMTDVPVDANIEKNEIVVTSSMGGELPSGIPIGEISDISTNSNILFKDIKIRYPINLNKVEVVSVAISDESS